MKIFLNFDNNIDINKAIFKWAKKNDLMADNPPLGMKLDDFAYCYSYRSGKAKTFISINTLDDVMDINAFTIADDYSHQLPFAKIGELLKALNNYKKRG